jgi:hypothetical protein
MTFVCPANEASGPSSAGVILIWQHNRVARPEGQYRCAPSFDLHPRNQTGASMRNPTEDCFDRTRLASGVMIGDQAVA